MKQDRLQGWKEIAAYLKVDRTQRTLERWVITKELPVQHERGGDKPRVFAWKSDLDRWKLGRDLGISSGINAAHQPMTSIGPVDREFLFSYPGGHADAVCLFGQGDAYVSPKRLHLRYDDGRAPYESPQSLKDRGAARIARAEHDARVLNRVFFNGPNARLLHFHHNQEGAAETDTLELVLGPVGWFDFEATNQLFRERQEDPPAPKDYVDLRALFAQDGRIVEWCKLSNIIGNAITLFTSDGYVGYQIRGEHQSVVQRGVTSAVAENVNRYLDDVSNPRKPRSLINKYDREAARRAGHAYLSKGIPHLVATVRRGIKEEVSPAVMKYVEDSRIKLTGLAFGLDSLQPDALWVVPIDLTAERLTTLRIEEPGRDAGEGLIRYIPATFGSSITQTVLRRPDWVAAGKASLIRAIQLIDAVKPRSDPASAFDLIAAAS